MVLFAFVATLPHAGMLWRGLLALILFWGQPALHFFREQDQLKLNRIEAWSEELPFFLILRSISDPELQEQVQRAGRTADTFSFLEYIEDATLPLGRLVYIGGNLSYVKLYGGKAPRAIVLPCEGRSWWDVFKGLSAASRAIILIPQTSKGVMEEMTYLREHELITKTIVVMPPERRFKNSANVWQQMAHDLKYAGFSLPPYATEGGAFIPNADLSIARMINFTVAWQEKLVVRSAIEELLKEIRNPGIPLKDAMVMLP